MKKVVKFGGSSLANADQFKKVGAIITADDTRRYVVPSAPGKRFPKDTKVTDMLYACYESAANGEDFSEQLDNIHARYQEIIDGLNLDFSLDLDFVQIKENFSNKAGADYAASRGECLNGKIMAAYLGFEFVDAAEVVRFNDDGSFNDEVTNTLLSERLQDCKTAVIPGFYGAKKDGTIVTFSRGGSDITGSLVALAVQADLYENWTDVSGILMADPRIVDDPDTIERITYNELRELSYMGAQVLHEGAVFPVREKNIPLNIRNTNEPDHPGTLIMERFADEEISDRFITGIAGRKNFSIITVSKAGMSSQMGSLRQMLEVFEKHGVCVEYTPSGIDSVSFVVAADKAKDRIYSIVGEIRDALSPDNIQITGGISVVAAVGRQMAFKPGTSGRIFAALGKAGINIRMISQGPDELNIIVGVNNDDFESCVRVLYNSFVK